ncbi:hypothetical protein K491DRAFT_711562 [Lophiostoma macrostomum CBS 122681]|uniref:Uncharacterized protein n=1 Tax=Lophiostoma macrostomum CBS 122681 TaxID=1314788 RepID=A0A6A6TMW5_9PLEO|nr:hypothetical protein K491DRAFT_711562 [Lophiostoma macrostomum CBS 122681]
MLEVVLREEDLCAVVDDHDGYVVSDVLGCLLELLLGLDVQLSTVVDGGGLEDDFVTLGLVLLDDSVGTEVGPEVLLKDVAGRDEVLLIEIVGTDAGPEVLLKEIVVRMGGPNVEGTVVKFDQGPVVGVSGIEVVTLIVPRLVEVNGTDVELLVGGCDGPRVVFAVTDGTIVVLLLGNGGALVRVDSVVMLLVGNGGALVRVEFVVILPLGSGGTLVRVEPVVILPVGNGGALVKEPVVILLVESGGALVRVEFAVMFPVGNGGWLVSVDSVVMFPVVGNGGWLVSVDSVVMFPVGNGGWLVSVDSVVIFPVETGDWLVCVEFVIVAGGKVEETFSQLDVEVCDRTVEVSEGLPGKLVFDTDVELVSADVGSVGKDVVLMLWLGLSDDADVDTATLVEDGETDVEILLVESRSVLCGRVDVASEDVEVSVLCPGGAYPLVVLLCAKDEDALPDPVDDVPTLLTSVEEGLFVLLTPVDDELCLLLKIVDDEVSMLLIPVDEVSTLLIPVEEVSTLLVPVDEVSTLLTPTDDDVPMLLTPVDDDVPILLIPVDEVPMLLAPVDDELPGLLDSGDDVLPVLLEPVEEEAPVLLDPDDDESPTLLVEPVVAMLLSDDPVRLLRELVTVL